jgi:molybdenum cofactor cytidylyltransferase
VIAAIVLAAGKSERMGRPKMDLPWGETTVIGHVVTTLAGSGIDEIIVVTGGARDEVEAALKRLPPSLPIRTEYNPKFEDGSMLLSVERGLRSIQDRHEAVLITLGDQPQIDIAVVRAILAEFKATSAQLIVPSYNKHRGHPWLVGRSLVPALLNLDETKTLRDFLNKYADQIHYILVDTPSILQDLDTPADYYNFNNLNLA